MIDDKLAAYRRFLEAKAVAAGCFVCGRPIPGQRYFRVPGNSVEVNQARALAKEILHAA